MRTIGVISDTHGLLRPEALEVLDGADLILHAGDVGNPAILAHLEEIAPVHAVRGNTDYGALRKALPHSAVVDLGADDGVLGDGGPVGPVAFILHIEDELDLDPVAAGFAMVVTGHTHLPMAEQREGVLHLNPGSAGPKRFDYPVTVARVEVDQDRIAAWHHLELEPG
jgi:putative phosphoesterase